MLSRIFKKRDGVDTPHAEPTPLVTPESKARQAEEARVEWQPRLQSALGDDAALLLIAQAAPVLDIRIAAVEALVSEDALKHAERELRSHDSRVHRAAKRRYVTAVAQRENRAGAQLVIEAAMALADEKPLPANRLVAIDHDWQALDASLLEPTQIATFTELRERLNSLLREQGEAEQQRKQEQMEQQRLIVEAQQAQVEEEARLAALAAAELPPPGLETEPQTAEALPPKTLSPEQRAQLDGLLSQAEAALAEGQAADMQQHLQAADDALEALHGVRLSDSLRARLQALHAERSRLKAWQKWGGNQALDALVTEAEALARFTVAATGPASANMPKLKLKAHADSIQSMRARWKEIDRVGATANQSLWNRFDAALQIAYLPVSAQQTQLKAARQENLAAREALLATLEALPGEPPAGTGDLAAHHKEQLRALSQFQLAWRQLGPLEHTVPPAARKGLQARLLSTVERIEAPVEAARREAEAERTRLVTRAEALAQDVARNPATRDAPQRVRELQAEWQQHARTLPLARPVEGALWKRFRAATDAVFAQREAAFSARDAELAANLAAREALIASLSAIDLATAPVAEMQRVLGEADRAWRQVVEVPRAAVNKLDKQFHEARAAVAQAVAESAQKRWQAQCDGLSARLALCEERESASADEADLASRWAALDPLLAAWDKPLAQRWSQPPKPGPLAASACDETLLQLEAALDLPMSAESQAARRDLKLRALKDTLEGRAPQAQDPVTQRVQWFASALRQSGMSAAQRERLHTIVAALRQLPPGALGGAAR